MKTLMCIALVIPAAALAQETPGARLTRFLQYCSQQPPAIQVQCRNEATAAVQQYSAQYNAAMAPQQQQNQRIIQNHIEGKPLR